MNTVTICYFFMFVLFAKISYVLSNRKSKGFYNLTPNRKLSNSSVVDPSTTRMRCITNCLKSTKCRYVSYLPLNGECQQTEHVPGDGVVTLDIIDGWESYSGKRYKRLIQITVTYTYIVYTISKTNIEAISNEKLIRDPLYYAITNIL